MSSPRVSILIPNYNNGKDSSINKEHDMIGNLMSSLYSTLKDETTPFEIIAYDDGSTDDSLQTLKDWTQRTWNDGSPVISKLLTDKHIGILSVAANKLVQASSGQYLVRLDGDIVVLTYNWVSKLCEIFDNAPQNLGIIGPKQYSTDGSLHALGDTILHPVGYHHHNESQSNINFDRPIESEHTMGCFYCCKRAVHDDLDGYDERILRGQTIDFGLRAKLNGWKCWATPQIEFQHFHSLRHKRKTTADQSIGLRKTLDVFSKKWGFDRVSPDLDYVKKHYANTPLTSNAQVFGMTLDQQFYASQLAPTSKQLSFQDSEWATYAKDTNLQNTIYDQTQFIDAMINAINIQTENTRIGFIGNGAGVIGHILANKGIHYISTDFCKQRVEFAKSATENQNYPNHKPQFFHQHDWRTIPLQDNSLDIAILFLTLNHYPNPTRLINEVNRVLGEGNNKYLVTIVHTAKTNPPNLYTHDQLINQIYSVCNWKIRSSNKQPDYNAAIFQRIGGPYITNQNHTPEMLSYAKDKYALQLPSESLC